MIREAKGVAVHDLSFWSSTLPLLDGLPRIIREYQTAFSSGMRLSLSPATARVLHDDTLAKFAVAAGGGRLPNWREATESDQLGQSLFRLMTRKPVIGEALINHPIRGCGAVVGGECDVLWRPYILELKLTAKEPGVRDVRQVLVYAALLHLERALEAEVGLVANPRLGVALEFGIEELLLMTGGLTLDDFSSQMAQFLVAAAQSN